MSDVAEAALLSRSGPTRIVDELEARNWVERTPSQTDGRVLKASLTAEGRARLRGARTSHVANIHEFFLDPLGPRRCHQLKLAWEAVDRKLSDAADDGAAGVGRRRRAARRERTHDRDLVRAARPAGTGPAFQS